MNDASWLPDPEHDETLETNWLFTLRRERFRSRVSGVAHDYYVVHLADAVNVVAITPERQVVLVKQFRAGSKRDSLETPGGLLEPGEDPLEAGARELAEETGYVGESVHLVGQSWSNPSIMTSKITTIAIENARRTGPAKPDHSEELTVELLPVDEIDSAVRDGRIDHSLAVLSLLWWRSGRGSATID